MFQYRKRYSPVQPKKPCATRSTNSVSIPQAVFACATDFDRMNTIVFLSFNTASGIRLCNPAWNFVPETNVGFNTASGIRLCNYELIDGKFLSRGFNTASGIRLCNSSLQDTQSRD